MGTRKAGKARGLPFLDDAPMSKMTTLRPRSADRGAMPAAPGARRHWSDVAIPPGEHLADLLEEREISQSELARRMDRPQPAINEIVQGRKAITAETALQLEAVLGIEATFWMNLESNYRLTLARIERKKSRRTKRTAPLKTE